MLRVMAEKRRKFEPEFREGAVRIVTETGKSIPEVAEGLGINETTLASWVSRARRAGTAPTGASDELNGCGGRMSSSGGTTRNWRWSVKSSNAAWSCG
ncbi:transposase [Streptomyces sp. NPDC051366]|uniref:transposase n=1 Tax=Streptomyces sp. NPDC051366 TaxID=3365652 RepID=UPI0037A34EC6